MHRLMSLSRRHSSLEIGTHGRTGLRSVSSHWYFAALIAAVSIYYLFLLSNGTFQLFAPEMLDKVFDSMLAHLLRGEFTVDRDAIDFEAFTREGKTYAYFGVFPALLRLWGLPFVDIARAHLARFSCLTAVVVYVALQLRMLLTVHHSLPPQKRVRGLLGIIGTATVLSGPQVYILGSAWVYHEPVLWSAAMAAAFNLIVVRAAFGDCGLGTRDLLSLAFLAGLAINTRASVGMGLYIGAILLIAWTARERHAGGRVEQRLTPYSGGAPGVIRAVAGDPNIALPIALLLLFGIMVGAINFGRWGNPLTFIDFQYYGFSNVHRPNDFAVVGNYGDISLGRAWIGALYYATGIPYVLKAVPPFAEFLHARFIGIEAPPITPLLTNPLTICLGVVGLARLWLNPATTAGGAMLLRFAMIGHAATVVTIFSAAYLALRYRFDLAPFTTLAALVGYRAVSTFAAETSESWRKRLLCAAAALCVLGILGSHYVLLIHKVWSIGVPMPVRLALLPFAPFAHAAFEPR
jgi:hypothetical protein